MNRRKGLLTVWILFCWTWMLYAQDTVDRSVPNMTYIHRHTSDPLDIHILLVDLKNPGVRVETELSNDQLWGRETVSGMAGRHGAQAAVNGDFFSAASGIPQGLTVRNGRILVAPKFRTALGFTRNKSAVVGMWTDRWNWYAFLRDEQGNTHDIVMMNLDLNKDWLCLYTDAYGHTTPGSAVSSDIVEVLVGADSTVKEVRRNRPGIEIPAGNFVLSGREQAARWLRANLAPGEKVSLILKTKPDWRNLWQAISGGPRIVRNGAFYADPVAPFPAGEDFTLSFKQNYYGTRQPRCAAGVTVNRDTLILVVVDGRRAAHSIGVTLKQLADVLIEFGAVDGVQFDSGGSVTFFFDGKVRNRPSDGEERPVANSLGIFSSRRFRNIAPEAKILRFCGELLPDAPASKLIDGRRFRGSGKWVHAENHLHWIELDLGRVYPVTHFQLFHAAYSGDPDYLNTKEFCIFTRTGSQQAWKEDFHVVNERSAEWDNLCAYSRPHLVRFVRLEVPAATHLNYENYLRLPELEIFIEDTVAVSVTSPPAEAPLSFKLWAAYPNPSRGNFALQYRLSAPAAVEIHIWNLLGREIGRLGPRRVPEGTHRWFVQLRALTGRPLLPGVYFLRFRAGNVWRSQKILLLPGKRPVSAAKF